MSKNSGPVSEKLFLCNDDNKELFVESILHQHHIDGIRFLFKQLTKNKPGVILNNPLGYGNSLQVALFLGAIRHLLDKPILIICEESETYNWLEHFQKLTQCYNVVVSALSPFVKKTIFINTMKGLEQFTRRSWSVLVVDNDAALKEKTMMKKFEADYKIWITPLDMKEHLQNLSIIYRWIYPKAVFNIEDFKGKAGNCKDIISKAILLEAFVEDVVSRTTLRTPFENTFKKATPQKVSKKNKDATGTKIKRSKRTLDDTILNTQTYCHNEPGVSAVKIPKVDYDQTVLEADSFTLSNFTKNGDNRNEVENSEMELDDTQSDADIESFIRDKEPIGYKYSKGQLPDFDNISNNSQDSINDLHESDSSEKNGQRKLYMESDTNSESTMPRIDTVNEVNLSDDSNDDAYELETQEFLNDNSSNRIKSKNYLKHILTDLKQSIGIEENEFKHHAAEENDNNINIENEIKKVNDNVNRVDKSNREEGPIKTLVIGNSKLNKTSDSEMKNEPKVTKSENKIFDYDSKVSEHEEIIFKKFKGSFLDSIL